MTYFFRRNVKAFILGWQAINLINLTETAGSIPTSFKLVVKNHPISNAEHKYSGYYLWLQRERCSELICLKTSAVCIPSKTKFLMSVGQLHEGTKINTSFQRHHSTQSMQQHITYHSIKNSPSIAEV